jgi:YhcH/YjgK/YiaL family protein
MIVDQLENANTYVHISNRLAVALRYLQTNDMSTFAAGTYEIKDREIYAIVSEYTSKNIENAKWESHKKYADIQYVLNGIEKMGHAALKNMEVIENYNPDKDITILKGTGDYVTVHSGTFAIFFPQDAHQPGVAVDGNIPIKKVVVKVLM